MRQFECPQCGSRVYFDDSSCVRCQTEIGYDISGDVLLTLGPRFRCAAYQTDGCNWLTSGGGIWCDACQLVAVANGAEINDDTAVFRRAIRRVVRQLRGLALDPINSNPRLWFRLERGTDEYPVTIGHANGLITIEVREADPVHREQNRLSLGESYRTPLGHIRHETGHWHWQAHVAPDINLLSGFRELFGDETVDYQSALTDHYVGPDDATWPQQYLSHYAAAHPWEDYAESFAHVLHLLDTLETAQVEGLIERVATEFDELYQQWTNVTITLNELSRAMGVDDPYPFAPPPAAIEKMSFVYGLLELSTAKAGSMFSQGHI